MEFLRPDSWDEALAAKSALPGALPLAGGTDVMVALNAGRASPEALLDLSRLAELRTWEERGGTVRLGATVPYAAFTGRLGGLLPGLAMAARTVGSPQIRSRGSVGGNLGTASPAGDAHPPLLAAGAVVEAASVRGTRLIPAEEFYTGPKANALADDELIRAVRVPVARGPQLFAKTGTRNAMVIAVCSFALALDTRARAVRTGLGSAAPTPLRARRAEEFLTAVLHEEGLWDSGGPLPPSVVRRFAELAAAACRPVDDVRGTARYRAHAVGVLARRTLAWAWETHRRELRTRRCQSQAAGEPAAEGVRPCA